MTFKGPLDDRPPIGVLIKWDGSEAPPVPVGTKVTIWSTTGKAYVTDQPERWAWDFDHITAYMVHSYPEEPEVVDCWLELDGEGILFLDHPAKCEEGTIAIAHIRFTNGVAEIVGQEKP